MIGESAVTKIEQIKRNYTLDLEGDARYEVDPWRLNLHVLMLLTVGYNM